MLGGLDPYANPAIVGRTISTIDPVTVVEVPDGWHNLSPGDCIVELRRTWIEDPDAPVDPGACGSDTGIEFILP